ncbi:MAG: response regulator [Verrucomicrobiota bacterium]|jgi:CheY-like chemotaxis protein|nr:response regulator [Verrucomicrobiota bacterium]
MSEPDSFPMHRTVSALQPETIVVCDDDPDIRAATGRLLRKEGHQVQEAADGHQAIEMIRKHRPALVLMDVDFGDADGRDLCKLLKSEPELNSTFFVLISGTAVSSEEQIEGLEVGSDGYLTRPIGNRELVVRVQAFLRIRRAENARRMAEQSLFQAQRLSALGTLASGMGHEISNPLQGILGYAQLIMEEVPQGSSAFEFAQQILQECHRIKEIVQTVLILKPMQPSPEFGMADLGSVTRSTAALLGSEFQKENQISIAVDIPDDLSPIRFNPSEFRYCLISLLAAAKDALIRRAPRTDSTPKTIQVRTDAPSDGQTVRILISHNSDPIPEDSIAQVFDPFFTLGSRLQSQGLNLASAYRIVQNQGAELTVTNREDEWVDYSLTVPIL